MIRCGEKLLCFNSFADMVCAIETKKATFSDVVQAGIYEDLEIDFSKIDMN